ncbi:MULTISPECIES: hypothetical protein [unclassified Archaeoglobus]|jgi:hypothetical protein|uniref:hypothetical protein n=1 Tax=unclassified Archaeoglobus TaxID=2643606 RepID=UPI0025B7AD7F|nr:MULTISPECIES: hypothetical protein [unclassified Archaeoglobus]
MSDEEIFEQLSSKDITADLEITDGKVEERKGEEGEGEGEEVEIPDSPHPLTELLDMSINFTDQHAKELQSKGIDVPNVNMPLWENFGKPLLNRAFWYYFPESDGMEDPRIALLAGGALTALAVAPSLVGIVRHYRSQNEKEKRKVQNDKPKTIKQAQREQIKEVAKEAEEERQKQLEQAIKESPYLKKIKYEEFAGI